MKKNTSDTPITITDKDFDETVKKYDAIVIDCWAAWCGPCRMMSPIVDDLAKDMNGKVVFGKVNVDENPLVSIKYKIMSIPTLLVFKNGNLVDRIIGVCPKEEIKSKISSHL